MEIKGHLDASLYDAGVFSYQIVGVRTYYSSLRRSLKLINAASYRLLQSLTI